MTRSRSGIAAQGPVVDPEPHRLAVGRRADEAQQDRPQRRALSGGQALVEPVGRSGHRAADAAGRAVALDGEHVPVAPPPCLGQRVGQQRERARLALGVADQQVDEPRFEAEAGLGGGTLDGLAQVRRR